MSKNSLMVMRYNKTFKKLIKLKINSNWNVRCLTCFKKIRYKHFISQKMFTWNNKKSESRNYLNIIMSENFAKFKIIELLPSFQASAKNYTQYMNYKKVPPIHRDEFLLLQ